MLTAPTLAGLPDRVERSTPGRRLVGFVLELVLSTLTLGIGWLVWSLFVWGRGQTPAKQLLGMTVVVAGTRRPAGWWRMLARELLLKTTVGIIPLLAIVFAPDDSYWSLIAFPLMIVVHSWLIWDPFQQQLWDKLADTVVVDDPFHQLESRSAGTRAKAGATPLTGTSAASIEPLPPAVEQVTRAAEYLRHGMPDVALKLLRGAAEDARRRRDRQALEGLIRLINRRRSRIPAHLVWQADAIVEIARRGLRDD